MSAVRKYAVKHEAKATRVGLVAALLIGGGLVGGVVYLAVTMRGDGRQQEPRHGGAPDMGHEPGEPPTDLEARVHGLEERMRQDRLEREAEEFNAQMDAQRREAIEAEERHRASQRALWR